MLSGRIFLTGGAGYLGRGIMARAQAQGWDCQFVVYSRDEQKHYHAKKLYPSAKYVVGDIMDAAHMFPYLTMCDYVIHTAAIKYIPECEAQPSEALRINIDGSRLLMSAAREAGVKRVCMISTDKAAQPINTYGMTKALVERLVFESADTPSPSGTDFVACRYGNVIGSTGSVWPVFRDQYARLGRVRVTDPEMTRFYIPIEDAVSLIVSAFIAPSATVVIPQPQALRLKDLAEHVTSLWNADNYEVVGPRPGEKQHENMLADNEYERIAPFKSRWLLFGPTKATNNLQRPQGMRSDQASPLAPEDFVSAALASESI